jgi:hypothetical protein
MRPYSQLTGSTSIDIVSHRDTIASIFPSERLVDENISIIDNTIPADHSSAETALIKHEGKSRRASPTPADSVHDGDDAHSSTRHNSVPWPNDELAARLEPLPSSCTPKWAIYGGSRPCGHAQPDWSPDNAPFTHEIYDPLSNANWWQDDLRRRRAQLNVWTVSHATETNDDPCRLYSESNWSSHESLCDTYPVSSNLEWYKSNIACAAPRRPATARPSKVQHPRQAKQETDRALCDSQAPRSVRYVKTPA